MPLISKKISYDLPDEFLSQTNSLGLTGEYTYEGPDKIYVIIDPETKKIVQNLGFHPYMDDLSKEENETFMEQFSGVKFDYAPISFEEDPVLLAAVAGPSFDPPQDSVPQKTYTLKGETTPFYSRPESPFPSNTIDAFDVEWSGTSWKKPYPWKKPHITKEQLLSVLNSIIEQEKEVNTEGFTTTQKTKWASYLSALENIPVKYADYLDSPWMVPFPINPMALDNWSATKGNAFGMDNKAGEQKIEQPEGPIEYVDGKPFRDGKEIDISTVEPETIEDELGNEEEPV